MALPFIFIVKMNREDGFVDFWNIKLDRTDEDVDRALETLSVDEKDRLAKHRDHRVRRNAILTRHALRMILSDLMQCSPRTLIFERGRQGKPHLASHSDHNGIHFNVSHSMDLALIVVSSHYEVGIDVEYLRQSTRCLELAKRFFTGSEQQYLSSQPPENLSNAFYRIWTRKEALLKGLGHGIAGGLDRIDVRPDLSERLRIDTTDEAGVSGTWELHDLNLDPGYAGCLAVHHPGIPIRWRSYLEKAR